MNEETLTCGRCKTPYEIDEKHVIFKKGKMAYIRCPFCNQVRRVAWNVVEHLKPSVEQEKHVISKHVKPVEYVKEPVKSSTKERKIVPSSESSKKEKISELSSDSVPPDKEIKDQDPDRKNHEVVKTLSKDTSESDKEATPKREGSEISELSSDSEDSGNGVGWALAGLGSLIVVGLGVLLGGRQK